MATMFGLIVAGRLVQTDFRQLPEDPTKFSTDVYQASDVNHVVVFLTGIQPFPEGLGAQVYFGWPDESNQLAWHLLGSISNEKPSAIFKISNLKKSAVNSTISPSFFGSCAASNLGIGLGNLDLTSHTPSAKIGLSVESITSINQSTPAATTAPVTVSAFVEFSQKMLENFVNYATSFGDSNYISLQTVKNWYDNFQRRLQADPYFWR
ncbi:unnamed protein product [Allacma fusca]|uniref:Hikeshi-like domain-containing protein n=1 Tax=Allacma fusca TaxID=39272 RepID=A0A8J2L7D2_9HEXA|nr:unnamed protein product [Allacma fusca]